MTGKLSNRLSRITKALYGDKVLITLRVVEYNPADARELSKVEEPGLQVRSLMQQRKKTE